MDTNNRTISSRQSPKTRIIQNNKKLNLLEFLININLTPIRINMFIAFNGIGWELFKRYHNSK